MKRSVSPKLAGIPEPSPKRIALYISAQARRAVREGHPWLYENSIQRQSHAGGPGDLAVLFDQKGRFLAVGLYDPLSAIRVRILQQGEPRNIGLDWFREKLSNAIEKRRSLLFSGDTTAFRLVHGENDGLPGLVVDRYEDTLVIKLYSAAWVPHLATILAALERLAEPARVVLRLSRATAESDRWRFGLQDGDTVYGTPPSEPICFKENGLRFEADVVRGHKTGFYLDQRDNRRRSEEWAGGREVLNVFAYTGGFSVYVARGGARAVTSLDANRLALAAAERNFERNKENPRIAEAIHTTECGDAFELLEEMGKSRRQFGMVIVDPPSFAKQKAQVPNALAAYRRLIAGALGVLQPSGVLIAASCSSRVSAELFFQLVHEEAVKSQRPLQELHRSLHPVDHPVQFQFGSYLKCLFAIAP